VSIRTIIFDLGKVLVDFDYTIAARRLAARGKLTEKELGQFLLQSPLLYRYETGLLSDRQFYAEVCQASGFRGDLEEFSACFADIFVPIPAMVDLHAALRRRGLPTYIFSNTNGLAVAHIRRSFPFFSHFDGYILSFEHGAMKPDPKLYEVVERESARKGAELLYIDDRPENIETAAARGWNVILQESPQKTRTAIEQLGLLNHQ
jgi:HAD superfamily hydrolase (TIGR01509 family)